MSRGTRNLLLLIAAALVLWALGQLVYRSGILVDEPSSDPDTVLRNIG
ncbi:MAG: hypothetical protein ACK4K7_08425 [Allosphingosinicella sp.]